MADKPKVAICWLGGCGGCDEAVVDINEVILNVAEAVDLIMWPVALDFKYHRIEAIGDGGIALSIVNGNARAIRPAVTSVASTAGRLST